jgi:4,5-dihydroxyphthalate decarboxylase
VNEHDQERPALRRLRTLLGDSPVTAALKSGAVRSPQVEFDFAEVKAPATAFKRVVRNLEFDLAELAITTCLIAKTHGKPLVLLPAVVFGRMQHPRIVYDTERGPLAPGDLAGRRVGVRSYSVTTGMWIRGILAEEYGVDCDRVTWVTFEEAHVAEFRDPPNVERAPAGKDLVGMLLAGEIDAAIVGDSVPSDPRLAPLIPDSADAAEAWQRKWGAIQINHMVAVRDSLPADTVHEVYRLLRESWHAAGDPATSPIGLDANRRNLEVAIDFVHRQRLIPRRFALEELFGGLFA